MEVSVGVFAHNEEKNIGKLLSAVLNQELKCVRIREIIVVSSASTDKTDDIVRRFSLKNGKIKLITQRERKGKTAAINEFLKAVQSDIIVQISGDVLPKKSTIEKLCKPLENPSVGIVGGHPVPINKKTTLMGFICHFLWELHHEISLLNPKPGEIIAYRKAFGKIPSQFHVDEDSIANVLLKKGYELRYAPDAVVYNKGPETFSDFLKQRRRIYSGHLYHYKQTKYKASTTRLGLIFKALLKTLPKNIKYVPWIPLAILAEVYGRLLGMYDFYIKKDRHLVWEVVESAKIK